MILHCRCCNALSPKYVVILEIYIVDFKFESGRASLVKAWDNQCFTHSPELTKCVFLRSGVSSNPKKKSVAMLSSPSVHALCSNFKLLLDVNLSMPKLLCKVATLPSIYIYIEREREYCWNIRFILQLANKGASCLSWL